MMNVRQIPPFHRFLILGIGVLVCVLRAVPAAGADYELRILPYSKTASEQVLLVKLKTPPPATSEDAAGEVLLGWTTPEGRRTSFSIHQVTENVWVSRVSLTPEAGRNRLDLMILRKSPDGTLGKPTELIYELEMPARKLTLVRRKEAVRIEAAVHASRYGAKRADPPRESSFSVPVIVILVVFDNLVLLVPGLLGLRIYRKIASPGRDGGNSLNAAVHPLLGNILAGAGMIDRKSGAPLTWGQENAKEAAATPVIHREALEATLIEPPESEAEKEETGLEKVSVEEIKHVSTEELLELVAGAVERLDQGRVSEELKELLQAAEQELAYREHDKKKAERKAAAEEEDKPSPVISGRDTPVTLDMNDLSF